MSEIETQTEPRRLRKNPVLQMSLNSVRHKDLIELLEEKMQSAEMASVLREVFIVGQLAIRKMESEGTYSDYFTKVVWPKI